MLSKSGIRSKRSKTGLAGGWHRFRILSLSVLVLVLSMCCYQPSFGQSSKNTDPKPAKLKDVSWYEVVQVALKPGKRDDFINIIKKYYEPAGKAVGYGPVMLLEDRSGPWDLTAIWPLKGGVSYLEWKRSPGDVAWYKQFLKLAGSPEKAKKIREEYLSDIDHATSYITYQENDVFGNGMK